MRIGEFKVVGIARHGDTHVGLLVDHHETAGEIEVVHVVAIYHEQVIARDYRHHVLGRELELVVDVIDQGVARKGVVVQMVRIVSRGILNALDVGRLPVVAAMDEGVVEHLTLPIDDVERKSEPAYHILKRDDGVVQLVVVGIKQHGLHLRLVVEVAARQVEILGKEACCQAKRQD